MSYEKYQMLSPSQDSEYMDRYSPVIVEELLQVKK